VPPVGTVALRIHLIEDHHLGHFGGRSEEGRDAHGTEAQREAELLVGLERLVAEEQHEVLQERVPNRVDRRVVELGADVDTCDFGADRRRERCDRQGHALTISSTE
jgi:hypothetical protein